MATKLMEHVHPHAFEEKNDANVREKRALDWADRMLRQIWRDSEPPKE